MIVTERESRGRPDGGADDNEAAILSTTGVEDPLGTKEVTDEIVGGEVDIAEATADVMVDGEERDGASLGC